MFRGINIGFLPLYDIHYASTRYRVFQFFNLLRDRGYRCHVVPAPLFKQTSRIIYLPRLLKLAIRCDVLYIQKRLLPRWILNLVTKVNEHIIFDFDDALYLHASHLETFNHVLKSAKLVITGNQHLSEYASKYNPSTIIIPTVLDTDHYKAAQGDRHPDESRVLIGWIGYDSERGDLDLVRTSLEKIGSSFLNKVSVLIIARQPYSRLTNLTQIFIPWKLETSLQALQKIDIGIMPLEDNAWNRGKCAFKLIQYSSVNASVIASPVGVNKNVVLHGSTGFLAETLEEWFEYLSLLIRDSDLRTMFGKNGRQHIVDNYSIKNWFEKFVDSIEFVARQ